MPSPFTVLYSKVTAAIVDAFGDDARGTDPALRPSQFADLQSNAALALARRFRMAPRDAAQRLIDHLRVKEICAKVEVSGPGYINLTLSDLWIARQVTATAVDGRLGVPRETPQRVVIDYSAPNVAKEMHVGHLRTTVVGDALARVLAHLGHTVIRQNHIGDWGTPFGMLIEHLLDVGEDSEEARGIATDPNAFYQSARVAFDTDPLFATRARARVVALQAGDEETLRLWAELVELSRQYFAAIYARLGVTLADADLAGESTYNDDLPRICEELEAAGIATLSQGALCVFLPGYMGREGRPVPLIIRKSDGGFGYGTTDLAAVRYRIGTLHADRLVYVIGAPQALHLNMVWDTARRAGWLPPEITPTHVQIGNVLGPDHKILKTRSGAPLRLAALLDEAVATARAAIDEDRPELDEPTRSALAPLVGIGAVKYADLSIGHATEYAFDLERMVALNGNTSRYLQYAAARLRSLLRKAGVGPDAFGSAITVVEPAERALALRLLDFGEVTSAVGRDLEPHRLCSYLFELAQTFSVFYEQCAVVTAEPELRASRLALCALALRVLVTGLDLLGIASPDTM